MILEKIKNKINKKEELSPLLFLWKNTQLLSSKIEEIIFELFNIFKIPKFNLIKLEDNWEKIKINEIKEFIAKSKLQTPYEFQIFFIENISRFTLQSANACLKFFEEPWIWNIIFLSNSWENGILETILSRVEIIHFNNLSNKKLENNFYFNLLDNYINKKSTEIFTYFYKNKLEKEEYIDFLENLILYAKKNLVFFNFLEELEEDINLIKQNNLFAKNIVDKYLLKI